MAFVQRILASIVLTLFIASSATAQDKPVVHVGLLFDGLPKRYDQFSEQIKDEIITLTEAEYDVRFLAKHTVDGKWKYSNVVRGAKKLLNDPQVDIIIAQGVAASNVLANQETLSKPVILPYILDVNLQNLSIEENKSGIKNLNFLFSAKGFELSLQSFYEVVKFKRLAIIASPIIAESVPSANQLAKIASQQFPFSIELISVSGAPANIVNTIPAGVDAVMVAPLMTLTEEHVRQLADLLIERGLPSFSFMGKDEVELGLLTSTAPKADYVRIARRVALNLQSILLGEEAGELPVIIEESQRLTINMATARAINAWPNWSVLTEADLINEEENKGLTLTLGSAMEKAMTESLDTIIAEQEVKLAQKDILSAQSALWPQIDVSYEGRAIDKDRAEAGFGAAPEYETSGTLTANQAFFDETVWSTVAARKLVKDSFSFDYDRIRLNQGQAAANAYLNVLRAKTFARIKKDDLKLTRSNLDIARIRKSIGVANPAEVFRLESDIANKRQEVLKAQAQYEKAMVELSRILRLPQKTTYLLAENSLSEASFFINDERLKPYVDNPWVLNVFNDFMVQEAIDASPELKSLRSQIAVVKRLLLSSKRAFYLPSIGISANVNEKITRDGDGVEQAFDLSDFGFGDVAIENDIDDLEWNVAFQAKFPLFTGGRRIADLRKLQEELIKIRYQFDQAAAVIQQRVRSAMFDTGASFPSIELAQQSAKAAQKNLELVMDSYSKGVVSILDIIDAQNASFVANEAAANALYDFMIDLIEVQRAVGQFDYFIDESGREQWFARLEAFFLENTDKNITSLAY